MRLENVNDAIKAGSQNKKRKKKVEKKKLGAKISATAQVGMRVRSRKRGRGFIKSRGKKSVTIEFDEPSTNVTTATYDCPGAFLSGALIFDFPKVKNK